MIRKLIFITITLISISAVAQEKVLKLTLQEVIDIANRQSIDAFKNKNMYFSSYWAFKYYRASRLPSLSIASNPLSYSNSIRQDYDYTNHQYINTQQNNITSYAALKMAQLVGATEEPLTLVRIWV